MTGTLDTKVSQCTSNRINISMPYSR